MGNLCVTGASSRSKKEERQKAAVEAPPSPVEQTTFKWTIVGFSSLLDFDEGWTASRVFEISGVKWYLMVNPRDTKSGDQNEYVSLLLQLSGASMRSDTIVEATFKFFIYGQTSYMENTMNNIKVPVISENKTVSHSFQTASPRSGTSCMIPLATLKEQSSGFLYGNSCVFGVEFIKVISGKSNDATEKLFVQKEINKISSSPKVFSWNIEDFFLLKSPSHSPEFELCGNGRREFSKDSTCWGYAKFISLEDFKDPSKGYLVKTKCCIEAWVAVIGTSKME